MMTITRFALTLCLATSVALPVATSARAEPATTAPAPSTPAPATPAPTAEKPAVAKTSESGESDAEKRARAADCSRQADAKKLHGEKRKTFREECKRKK